MATAQAEGMHITTGQSSQIIPVITTEVSDQNDNKKDNSPADKARFESGSVSNTTKESSSVIGVKNNGRVRQVGRSGGVHSERRYHTTGVIEDIKVNLVFFQKNVDNFIQKNICD